MFARKYGEAFEARTRDRAAFKEAFTMRYGRRAAIHYPSDLNCIPKFCGLAEGGGGQGYAVLG
jgi:hypothetical protein